MKGRGARTIAPADFQAVTPDADRRRPASCIVDAVGVTEHDFVEPPLNREKSVSLKKLLDKAATSPSPRTRPPPSLPPGRARTRAHPRRTRRARRGRRQLVRDIVRGLVDAVDPDVQAKAVEGADDPAAAVQQLLDRRRRPIAANPDLRSRILELRRSPRPGHRRGQRRHPARRVRRRRHRAGPESIVESWRAYLDEHRDEITAIQLLTEARERRIVVRRHPGARRPDRPTAAQLDARHHLERLRRDRCDPQVRHSDRAHPHRPRVAAPLHAGADDELVPYADRVREQYAGWLAQQEQAGVMFTDTERWWLDRMVEVIAASAGIRAEDLDDAPFTERGGTDGAIGIWAIGRGSLIDELNAELTA